MAAFVVLYFIYTDFNNNNKMSRQDDLISVFYTVMRILMRI